MVLFALIPASFAADVPLPEPKPRAAAHWSHGNTELVVGTGVWQVPSISRGGQHTFPRLAGHATLKRRLGRTSVFAALHVAGQAFFDVARGDVFRVEPRLGLRLGPRFANVRLDASFGVSIDATPVFTHLGPVFALNPNVWFADHWFVGPELRICPSYDQQYQYEASCANDAFSCTRWRRNPGGTGVLLALGHSF